jgi:hypothetical protein
VNAIRFYSDAPTECVWLRATAVICTKCHIVYVNPTTGLLDERCLCGGTCVPMEGKKWGEPLRWSSGHAFVPNAKVES